MTLGPLAAIPFTPPPIFQLGPLQFSAHGLAFLVAALVALHLTKKRLPAHYHQPLDDLIPAMILGAALGARGLYFMLNPDLWGEPWRFFTFWEGGLVSYGGLVGALLAFVLRLRQQGLPLPYFCDALAPAAVVGWGIGRLGCFLNWYGEYGTFSTLPWAVVVDGESRHPVMLYLSLALILYGACLLRRPTEQAYAVTGLAFLGQGAIRFVLDEWRAYEPPSLLWASRTACLVMMVFGYALWRHSQSHLNEKNLRPSVEDVPKMEEKNLG